MVNKSLVIALLSIILLVACNPPTDINRNEYREENRYPQDFKTTIAFLVLEWNGIRPHVLASAFLADKEKGIFYTAKHFTDAFGSLGPDYCKVFFNGKVYKARVVKVPPVRDAALIRLVPPFSTDDFPEPLSVVKEKPKFGDKVFIQGFHPHGYWIREANKSEGFLDLDVPIVEKYYKQVTKDLNKETQVVFDDLESVMTKINPNSVRKNPLLSDEEKEAMLEFENDRYIKILTKRDHKFSFGGLSGGATVNTNGELVGIITAQDIFRYEFDERGLFFDPRIKVVDIKKQLFDTLYITPIGAIADLDSYIKSVKD